MLTFNIRGLSDDVVILIDKWGIPHVYAQTPLDAYVGQGFAAARDRLWQMELWRRRGLGLLAEAFGEAFVEADSARRLFLYRGSMADEWAAYGDGVRDIVEAFVRGINAYIALVEDGSLLPPLELSWRPMPLSRWSADDIVRIRSVGLRMNVTDEFARLRLAAIDRLDLDIARRAPRPAKHITLDPHLDPRRVPHHALRTYNLAMDERAFATGCATADGSMATASNVWALDPSRTVTGRPILANDPHRAHVLPSLRWLVHLDAPGLRCAGATEPVHPGVSNGHNERVAFGFTHGGCDQEDLLVYSLANGRVRTSKGWRELTTIIEHIPLEKSTVRVELKFLDGEPVIFEDADRGLCLTVRSAFLRPGGAPYFAGVNYHRSSDMNDFEQRLDRCIAPAMNYCAADAETGEIGLFVRGAIPIRGGGVGALPQDGAFAPDWDAFQPPAALPTVKSPANGWVASCNQVPLPHDFDHEAVPIGQEFSERTRFDRLASLLDGAERHDLTDCGRYQNDQRLEVAPVLLRDLIMTRPALPDDFITVLRSWNGDMHIDSAPAAFFATWTNQVLRPALVKSYALNALETGEALAFEFPSETIAPGILRATAEDAFAMLSAQLGADPMEWTLGAVQTFALRHPMPGAPAEANFAAVAIGGSEQTLNKAAVDSALNVAFGPSFRLLLDVGAWDECRAVNLPGQSGDPASPHYRDHFDHWRHGTYVPLLWTRQAVEANAKTRIFLRAR